MTTADVYNKEGKKVTKVNLPKNIFGVKVNPDLLAQAIRVYLANQRQSPAKSKTRSEVAYSTAKLFKQKGTGRARHGSKGAPIFVKGGVAHGPTGEQNYQLKLNKKTKQKALRMALTDKLNAKQIVVMQGLDKLEGKTAKMSKIVEKFPPSVRQCRTSAGKKMSKVTIVLPKSDENIIRAGRNIPYLKFLQAKQLNTYQVLNTGFLVFTKESLKVLEDALAKKTN